MIDLDDVRRTLEVFADPLSWRLDGTCDPSSANFCGLQMAQEALALLTDEGIPPGGIQGAIDHATKKIQDRKKKVKP